MLGKIRKTIKKFDMLKKGDAVVVCVSGGVDSVVLLHALAGLAAEYKLFIIAAHLNHCLRGKESDRDEAFVKGLAEKLGVKFIGKRVDVRSFLKKGDSLQDVARKVRYEFFEEIAKRHKADKIATGHNLDDQAETMVMRFLTGAGLRGLCGIPPARRKYIRPLIDITRQDIEKYAEGKRLKFVKDSSNQSAKYLRNRIRLKLMPALMGYNPAIKNDMARLSRILARDEDYLEDNAQAAYENVVMKKDKNAVSLSLNKLRKLHDAIKVRIFFMAAEELCGSAKGFYSYHAEDFLMLLLSGRSPNASITLPHSMAVYREYDVVTIEKRQEARGKPAPASSKQGGQEVLFEKALKINGKTAVIADNGFKIAEFNAEIQVRKGALPLPPPEGERRGISLWRGIKVGVAYFDYDKLQLPLIVRNFMPGDKFAPFGMKGRKKVKELFQEKKIAKRKRCLIPIVVSGDAIIWVAGIRQAGYGKIEPETKKILKIEMC